MTRAKVLIIDDDKAILDLLAHKLSADGYEVITAMNGLEGLKLYDDVIPDVVVSDINMPKMDGLEVLREINKRALTSGKATAGVIFLSGTNTGDAVKEALRLGAFDYLSKPIDFHHLTISTNRILELKKAEREQQYLKSQLFQTAKQASVGTLAAGIAHELNNPLAVVAAYVDQFIELLEEPLKGPTIEPEKLEHLKNYLNMIDKSTVRMHMIVNNLLAYADESGTSVKTELDLNKVINSSFAFLKDSFEKLGVSAELCLATDLLPFLGDFGQLESVFTNLMANSRDAFQTVKDDRIGQVKLTTSRRANGGILVVYEDNAGGMPPDVVARIFDPFFTTKEVGKGTGLGMSVTLGIVENHKGKIAVESTPGVGTKFTLTF